jgi:hypothetical protein
MEYGDHHIATQEDMRMHAANATAFDIAASVGKEELQWMSQWSPDEELMVDYSSEIKSSWSGRLFLFMFGAMLAIAGVSRGTAGTKASHGSVATMGHSHWV